MKPPAGIALFDSAATMARSLACHLHGKPFRSLGEPWFMRRLAPALNYLPRAARRSFFSLTSLTYAVPPDKVENVSSEAAAEWFVSLYPKRRYPVIAIGSSSGALMHICAALGAAWLPQTFLTPVRHTGVDPDDPQKGFETGSPVVDKLLAGNPNVAVHYMHDSNQDRLVLRHMGLFRQKFIRLPKAYRRFIETSLEPGGTLLIVNCDLTWPVRRINDRAVFQFGGVGGASIEEYYHGGERVEAYLKAYGDQRRKWSPPHANETTLEAEWGFEPRLAPDIEELALDLKANVRRLRFSEPEELSAFVADFYRDWLLERGEPPTRLIAESFMLLDPHLVLRTGAVPFWLVFNAKPSVDVLLRYLDESAPFDEIFISLFPNGVEAVGQATMADWQTLLDRARVRGELLAVDRKRFPADLATLVRYSKAMEALSPAKIIPSKPVRFDWLEKFASRQEQRRSAVRLTG
jgi:hypothetical protein